MKKLNKKGLVLSSSKGFTLIEVVLVLAIGGLIFLLAFIAFQQVSANRRDTQRRSDAGRVIAELQNYSGDTKSKTVTDTIGGGTSAANTGICSTTGNTLGTFATRYICNNGIFYSPKGSNYNTRAWNDNSTLATDEIRISLDLGGFLGLDINDCKGDPAPTNTFKVEIGLEKGIACRDLSGI